MRKLVFLAVLSATVGLIMADMASARGGRGGSCCSSGCYSGCGYGSTCGYGSSYGYSSCYAPTYSSCYAPTYSYGCYGRVSYGCYTVAPGCYYAPVVPMAPVPAGGGPKKEDGKGKTGGTPDKEEPISAPATLVVSLPADATLKVDDYQTTSTSSTRVLTTPVLAAGKTFTYTLKAEVVRDGKARSVEQVVKVRAGETTPVTLTIGEATGVASR